MLLGTPRRRLAGGEGFSRVSQIPLNRRGEWVRAAEDAPRGRFDLLESRHGLVEIVERGAWVFVEG